MVSFGLFFLWFVFVFIPFKIIFVNFIRCFYDFITNFIIYYAILVIMLLEFAVENFKSFRERTCFSMEATADKKLPENVAEVGNKKLGLLKTSIIYGANASGKTNFFEAMDVFKRTVMSSHTYIGVIPNYAPFIFDETGSTKPISMEIKFLKNGILYEYAFSYDSGRIRSESLIYYPNRRKTVVFERDGQNFKFISDKSRQRLNAEKVKETALYLTVSAQFNYDVSKNVVEWILNDFLLVTGTNPLQSIGLLLSEMESDPLFKKRALKAFQIADFGIVGINDRTRAIKTMATEASMSFVAMETRAMPDIWVKHTLEGSADSQKTVELPLAAESSGTIKFMSVIGPIIAALSKGGTVIIDEMDTSFHPDLFKWIINLFHDPEENKNGAQLVFNTHNPELLNLEFVRRDQI